jgi:hypothetical protein
VSVLELQEYIFSGFVLDTYALISRVLSFQNQDEFHYSYFSFTIIEF